MRGADGYLKFGALLEVDGRGLWEGLACEGGT